MMRLCFTLLTLGTCLLLSCRPSPLPSTPAHLGHQHAALYAPHTSSKTSREAAETIRELIPNIKEVNHASLKTDLEWCLENQRVLLVTSPSHLSLDDWPLFKKFLSRGGSLLFLGHNPLEADVRFVKDKPRTKEDRIKVEMERAEGIANFSEVTRWEQKRPKGPTRGTVRLVEPPTLPWPGVLVDTENFSGNHFVQSPLQKQGLSSHKENAIAFYARGGRSTTRIVLTFEAKEGITWHKVISVTERWMPYVIPLNTFQSSAKDRQHKPLLFRDVRRVRIGLDTQYAPQLPGSRQYGVSDIRMVRTKDLVPTDPPDELFFAKQTAHFNLRSATIQSVLTGQLYTSPLSLAVQSPVPTSKRGGFIDGISFARWVPVGEIRDEKGHPIGWPASLYVRPGKEKGGPERWGWIGLEPSESTLPLLEPLLIESVHRLRKGWFLFGSGIPGYCVKPGETLSSPVDWLGVSDQDNLRVSCELIDSSGFVLRKVVTDTTTEAPTLHNISRELNLGTLPNSLSGQRDIILRIQIEETHSRGRVLDQQLQELKVLGRAQPVGRASRVAAAGPQFTYRKRPTALLGVNYAPAGEPVGAPATTKADWLHPAFFNPEIIRRDLDHLSRLGFNTLAIKLYDARQANQLKYFAAEAQSRHLWLQVEVAGLDPLAPNWNTARTLLEAAEIKNLLPVFALNLCHDANLGGEEARQALNPLWRTWLSEQYGSLRHARAALDPHLRLKNDDVIGPTDKDLLEDGPHRMAVAAYRRFIDDMSSREFAAVLRSLHNGHYNQLITATIPFQEVSGLPVDAAAVGHHLDFITAGMGQLYYPDDTIFETGFVAAYARAASNNKPVSWAQVSIPTGLPPQPPELTLQTKAYALALDTALRSHVQAFFVPAQLWEATPSDLAQSVMGLDGQLHPVREAFRSYSQRVRIEKTAPRVWNGRTAFRYLDARGMSALWDTFRDDYVTDLRNQEMQELRWPMFGSMTTEIPPLTLNGSPYTPSQPLRDVNSEWGIMKVNGTVIPWQPGETLSVRLKDKLEMELVNIGSATWASSRQDYPGTVWIEAQHDNLKPGYSRVRTAGFGTAQTVSWGASDLGDWTLRPLLWDVDNFGEPLKISVQPIRPRLRP